MTNHEHGQKHHGHQHGHAHAHKRKGFHKDWRTWFVVGLMLLAMVIYVLSMDESLRPGSDKQGQPMPAAPAPPPVVPVGTML
jgi:hypothetical protein